MEIKNYWILLCFFSLGELTAQSFAINQYTVEDGLPSSFIYDITQDQEGFIWISTEGGLCRFDGNRFEKDPIPDGPKAEVVELEMDSKGVLWLIDLKTNISSYDGNSFKLEKKGNSSYIQFVNFKEDKLGNNWFLSEDNIIVEIQNEKEEEPYSIKYERNDLQKCESVVVGEDSSMYLVSNFGVGHFKDYQLNYLPFSQPFIELPSNGIAYEDRLLFSVKNQLFFFDPLRDTLYTAFDDLEVPINSEIVHLFYLDHHLWIATRTEGLILLKNVGQPNQKINRLLEGIIVGSLHRDKNGGYWLGTEGNGLFYLPNLDSQIIPNKSDGSLLTSVGTHSSGRIVLGYDDGFFRVLGQDFETLEEEYLDNGEERIYEIFSRPEGEELFLVTKNLWQLDANFKLKGFIRPRYLKSGRSSPDGRIWAGSSNTVGIYDEEMMNFERVVPLRTYAVEPISNGQAWLGTIDGLYFYDGQEAKLIEHPSLKLDIQDLQLNKDSTLWIATLNDGVLLYKGDSILHQFTVNNGLQSNHCRKVLLDDQFAWIATSLGVNQVRLDDFSKMYSIGKDEGLPSVEVNDLAKSNGQIMVATNKGLAVFKDTTNFGQLPVQLHLHRIKIQEKDTLIADEFDLTYEQNNIKIEFNGIVFRHAEDLIYEYQMEGIDEGWVTNRLGLAQYPSLPSGEYVFRVRAKTTNTDWSEEKVIAFRISKAYWEEWWFYLGLVLVAGILGAVFVRAILDDYQRRNEIQEKLKNSQLIALRARMNPHFLFNALNSIQELIIRNDKRSANRYLAQFSRLMRNTLNMSDKDEVSLQNEIESLELYLSLEALRFEKDFEYKFDIPKGVNIQEIKIPSLLIQPYVENAIIHGLMHRRGMKTLYISFKWKEPYLVVVVEDNGVGRKRAKEIQLNNGRPHPSTGMTLTQDRLELLNSTQQEQLNVVVEDLMDSEQKALGTRVTVYIAMSKAFWKRQKIKNKQHLHKS